MPRVWNLLFARFKHWKSILWNRLTAVLYAAYILFGIIIFIRDELIKRQPGVPVWHAIDFIPAWSASTWIIIVLATLLVFALEGSYRGMCGMSERMKSGLSELAAEYEADLVHAATNCKSQLAVKESEIAGLKEQLVTPKLVPEILQHKIEELPHASASVFETMQLLAGIEASDLIIKFSIRIRNANRPKSTATCSMYVEDRFGYTHATDHEPIPDIRQYPPLDLREPIEYGVPRSGWLFFRLSGKREASIVAGKLVLSVTDGNGSVSKASLST